MLRLSSMSSTIRIRALRMSKVLTMAEPRDWGLAVTVSPAPATTSEFRPVVNGTECVLHHELPLSRPTSPHRAAMAPTGARPMGNHQQNQQPRHEQKNREGQRLGDNNQGGKADEGEPALDQGGQGK